MLNMNIDNNELTKFEQDERDLLKNYLAIYNLPNLFKANDEITEWCTCGNIEFIIRPECTQNCSYCYIAKYGDDLYPKETRLSKEETLEHFTILMKTLAKKKLDPGTIDFFAGDLFYDGICFELFDILIKEYLIPRQQAKNLRGKITLGFPTNPSFMFIPGCKEKLIEYYDLLETYDCQLALSISTDGPYSVFDREKSDKIDQKFYDDLFEFAVRTEAGFHPMISAANVKYAVDNFNWWHEMYKKYNRASTAYPMMLFVRNDDWTDENIEDFCKLIKVCWDTRLNEQFKDNYAALIKYTFGEDRVFTGYEEIRAEGYDPMRFQMPNAIFTQHDISRSCSVQRYVAINVADFSIPLCHRTTYYQFTAGKLTISDDFDVDIIPQAVGTWISLKSQNAYLSPKCCDCDYKYFCLKGCLGAQFEHSGEILYPIDCICKLQKTIIDYKIKLYAESGILDYAFKHNLINSPIAVQFIQDKLEEFKVNKVEE